MPTSVPYRANRGWPRASISATRSLARVPESYPSSGLPDSPIPRWSTATTVKSLASSGISMRQAYQVWCQPWTSSSGGPSPPVTACRRSSPVSTYRLVNVPVNPSGRFGATETEPGPCGIGRSADGELIGIPFREWYGLTLARRAAQSARDIPGVSLARGPGPVPGRCTGRLGGLGVASGLGQRSVQFPPGADAKLGKDLAQVPFDRARAEVQLRADLGVGAAVAGQPGDQVLLRGQRGGGLDAAASHVLAGSDQFPARAFGERRHADCGEHAVGLTQLLTCGEPAALAAQPLAVQQVRAGQLRGCPA